MTNSEAIKILQDGFHFRSAFGIIDGSNALFMAINSLKENEKFKSQITTLSKANESLVKRDTANNFKIKDLESDIENYKSYLTTWNNANNGLLKYNEELKVEIKQLKARLHANDVKADFHAYCEMREYNDDLIVKNGFLRQENEELRATISKMETTTINEDDLK